MKEETKKIFKELNIHKTWQKKLTSLFESNEMLELRKFLYQQAKNNVKVYPSVINIFAPFTKDFERCKIIILGQDPYHTPGAAIGHSFLISQDYKKVPPSLRIIVEALEKENPDAFSSNMSLLDKAHELSTVWAKSDIICLNTTLTVEEGKADSHAGRWDFFTEEVLKMLDTEDRVWALWGKKAQKYKPTKAKAFCTNHPASTIYGYEFNPQFNEMAKSIGKDRFVYILPF